MSTQTELLSETEVLRLLREDVDAEGSQKAWAQKHSIGEAYLSDVLNKRRNVTPRICEVLGLSKQIFFSPKD